MQIVIDIDDYVYRKMMNKTICVADIVDAIKNGTPLKEWLSSFNTDSATECFTAIQRLKESVDDRLDEGNTR